MPSNAMKISHLMHHLQDAIQRHGDLDVVLAAHVDGALLAIDGRNVNVAGEIMGQRLPQPVLVFGISCDDQGRQRNAAGAAYAVSADAGEWNYDRRQMPDGEDVAVWKRLGGRDIGRREGERYFVREGASEWPVRPIEIIPAGILGFRLL